MGPCFLFSLLKSQIQSPTEMTAQINQTAERSTVHNMQGYSTRWLAQHLQQDSTSDSCKKLLC